LTFFEYDNCNLYQIGISKICLYQFGVSTPGISAFFFCVVFLGMMGLDSPRGGNFAFWAFFCFNTGSSNSVDSLFYQCFCTFTMHRVFCFCYTEIYSYFGQAFIACVPTVPTAQILAAVFIGLNNFFSGLIVRPQYLSGFFEIP
jgi:hypothetical protein